MSGTNLFLIGYRGTGKSTVARHLALALGCDWVDADVELELRAGKSIAAMFTDDGEPAFRDLESQVLADLCQRNRTIVATGGGVVLRPNNVRLMKAGGTIVWLRAAAATIAERVAGDTATAARRPNLTVAGGEHEIRALLAARTPIYAACADFTIDTESKTPREVADTILTLTRFSLQPSEPA